MPSIKVEDLAYVRLRAPDLDVMEEFLTHFGLIRAARTPSALYMRGTDPAHHHPRDGEGRARVPGARVPRRQRGRPPAARDGAGGLRRRERRRARRRPAGPAHGAERLPDRGRARHRAAAAHPRPEQPMNTGTEPLRRAGDADALRKSPTPIKRIGHGVLGTPKVRETVAVVPRDARLPPLGRRVRGRRRTTSSARSTGATAATSTSTTTRSSA